MTEKRRKTIEEALAGAKKMSERYTTKGPYRFFPDPAVVEEVQKGLADNEVKHGYRYCP